MLLAQRLLPDRWSSCAVRTPERCSQEPQIVLLFATSRERESSQR
jgi:isopenicillin N synthase-like dioxygenase